MRRFFGTARTDGPIVALRKTGTYTARRVMPLLPDRLRRHGPPGTDHEYLMPTWKTLAQKRALHPQSAPALLRKARQIALIGDLNLPQCRKYRVEQLAAFWRGRGVEVEFAHYTDVPRATRILQLATHVCEYRLPPTPVTEMLRYEARRLRLPILYDIDDPLFSVTAYETYANMEAIDPAQKDHFLRAAPGYLSMMNGADVVSLSTPGLVEHAALHTPRPAFLRRNFVDAETLEIARLARRSGGRSDGLFRFAFASGSFGHEADFEIIAEALTEVILAAPEWRLIILGHFDKSRLPAALAQRTELQPFAGYGDYLKRLARADCALMPLTDDPFNRCKSAVRVLDAAVVGVPSVVSAVGDLPFVVVQGATGWIVKDPSGWGDVL
ncbi:MAG: glycosyltransferase, partial [Sulfitobacter sp.]|nr:glycosyltransferase [Sulfitobacter sp.]